MHENLKTENVFFSVSLKSIYVKAINWSKTTYCKKPFSRSGWISFLLVSFMSTITGLESLGQSINPVLKSSQSVIVMPNYPGEVVVDYYLDDSRYTFCNGSWSVRGSTNCNGTITYQSGSSCTIRWTASMVPIGSQGPETVYLDYAGTKATDPQLGYNCSVFVNPATFSFKIVPCGSNVNTNPANGIGIGCGGSVDLTAAYTGTVNGSPAYTYQWIDGYGINIAGATSSSLTVKTSGNYRLVTTNSIGCSFMAPARTVTINSFPTTPTLSSSPATGLCPGGSVLLTASTIAAGYTYQWYTSGSTTTLISQGTSSTYSATTPGTYSVKVTNTTTGCVSASSNTVSVQVNTIPTAATIAATGPTTFCSGGNVLLSANTGIGLTYQWYNTGTLIPAATASNYSATTNGSYTVVVGSVGNCGPPVTSMPIFVTVNAIPSASFTTAGNVTTFCTGTGLLLLANTGTGLTYQWYEKDVLINNVPTTNPNYTTTMGGKHVVKVIANYANGYTCSNMSQSLTLFANATPSVAAAIITPTGPVTICQGRNVVLNTATVEGTNLSYQWKNNNVSISGATSSGFIATIAGSYTVQVSSTASPSCGASVTSIPTVATLISPPQPTIIPESSTALCPGGSVNLKTNPGTDFTYQWFNVAGVIAGATNSTYTATQADNYSVSIVYNTGCSSTSASITVLANTPPTVSITPANLVFLCGSNSTTLTANTTGLGLNYDWQRTPVGSINGATAATFTTNTPGTYQVKVSNNCGGIISAPVNVLTQVQGQLNVSLGSVSALYAGDFTSVTYGSCGITFQSVLNPRDVPNTFTVQLSDANGGFSNPEIIGSLYSGNPSGTINIHIPNNHPIGDHYRIRVVSDYPPIIGNDNGVDFSIYPQRSGSLFVTTGTKVVIPGNAAYNFPGDFTIEITVKNIISRPGVAMFLLSDPLNWQTFSLGVIQGSAINTGYLFYIIGGVQYSSNYYNTDVLKYNVCSRLALIRKNGVHTFFLDGIAIGSGQSTQSLTLSTSTVVSGNNNQLYPFTYYIDELRMWNVAISASDLINNTSTIVAKNRLGLVGNWSFNESSGQTVYDQSNTANHGTLGSTSSIESTDPTRTGDLGCAPIPPIPNNGLLFNGIFGGSRATIAPNPAYNLGTGNFTLEARVILSASQPYSATAMASNRAVSDSYSGFLFTAFKGTSLLLQVAGDNYMVPIGKNINDGACHHVAVCRLNGVLQFYVDGVPVGGLVNCAASINSDAALYLGFDFIDDCSVNGNVNEFRMWNTNRTAAQILANMNTVIPANTSNLVGYWRLNETFGETLFDSSPIANNGYLGTNASADDVNNPGRSNYSCYSYDRIGSTATINSYQIASDSSDFNNSNTVKIYPNPFTSETNIIISGNDFDQLEINIIDLQGMLLYTGQITSNKAYSIGQQLSNGIYFIKVTGAGKKPHVLKIIKNQ